MARKRKKCVDNFDRSKRVYSPKEIQDILGVSRTHIYQLIQARTFRTVKIANRYRISKKCFDRWMENNYGK